MEETIYIQTWIKVFALCSAASKDTGHAREMADDAAHDAVQCFDHGKMQDALAAKRKAIDAMMEGK